MGKYLVFVVICCLFVSCASILNGEWTSVSVYTEQPAKAIVRGDTLRTRSNSNTNVLSFSVPRSEEPLQFVIQTDSLRKTINIRSKNSQTYYLNALYFWPGFFVDMSNPKRYTYNSKLTFDKQLNLYDNRFATQKGDLYYYFSFPFIYLSLNTISPEGHSRISQGSVIGLSTGFDYYYKKDRFINLTGSMSYSGSIGCGDGYYWSDDMPEETLVDDEFNVYNLSLSHNHRLKRFSFGYGLSYAYIHYSKDIYRPNNNYFESESDFRYNNTNSFTYGYSYQDRKYSTLGLVFNGYCYVSRNFSVGIIYKPSFIRLKSVSKPFSYEHQLTLDFAFRFNILKRK